jgi:putative NIF3 family GTP cyclohydrolase 1 type 2
VQVVGNSGRSVRRVAVMCGAAGRYHADAGRAGAEVFLTGEMQFHDCLAAQAAGVGVILPGHYATERPGVEDLADRLRVAFPGVEVWASRREHDPLAAVL